MLSNYSIAALVLFAATSCRPPEESYELFADTTPKPLRVAIAENGDKLSVMIALNSRGKSPQYCLGERCDAVEGWQDMSEVSGKTGFYNIPDLAAGEQSVHLSMQTNEGKKLTRSFKVTSKTDEPETPQDDEQEEDEQEETRCHKADQFTCEVELAIHKYTNAYRARHNRSTTTFDAKLGFVSRDWSQKQYARRSIGHEGFPSARRSAYRNEFGNDYSAMSGENVAYSGGLSSRSADSLGKYFADMWYNSPGHQSNMLNSRQTKHGPGVYIQGGTVYATQIFGSR